MDINLGSGIKQLSIEGKPYTIDLYDLNTLNALDQFIIRRENGEITADEEMLKECKEVIDIMLGDGAYDDLFGDEKSIRPLKLIVQLKELYIQQVNEEELKEANEREEQGVEKIKEMTDILRDWNKQVNYTQNMYGNVVNKRRASKGNRNRR